MDASWGKKIALLVVRCAQNVLFCISRNQRASAYPHIWLHNTHSDWLPRMSLNIHIFEARAWHSFRCLSNSSGLSFIDLYFDFWIVTKPIWTLAYYISGHQSFTILYARHSCLSCQLHPNMLINKILLFIIIIIIVDHLLRPQINGYLFLYGWWICRPILQDNFAHVVRARFSLQIPDRFLPYFYEIINCADLFIIYFAARHMVSHY